MHLLSARGRLRLTMRMWAQAQSSRTAHGLAGLGWCWRTEQTLFSIVEMCLFSFRFFFPHELFRLFALFFFFLDSCRAGMNLNQNFISAPGIVYDCVYMHSMSLFAHIFDFHCIEEKKKKRKKKNNHEISMVLCRQSRRWWRYVLL